MVPQKDENLLENCSEYPTLQGWGPRRKKDKSIGPRLTVHFNWPNWNSLNIYRIHFVHSIWIELQIDGKIYIYL